jgi:hypothetical protein
MEQDIKVYFNLKTLIKNPKLSYWIYNVEGDIHTVKL